MYIDSTNTDPPAGDRPVATLLRQHVEPLLKVVSERHRPHKKRHSLPISWASWQLKVVALNTLSSSHSVLTPTKTTVSYHTRFLCVLKTNCAALSYMHTHTHTHRSTRWTWHYGDTTTPTREPAQSTNKAVLREPPPTLLSAWGVRGYQLTLSKYIIKLWIWEQKVHTVFFLFHCFYYRSKLPNWLRVLDYKVRDLT